MGRMGIFCILFLLMTKDWDKSKCGGEDPRQPLLTQGRVGRAWIGT